MVCSSIEIKNVQFLQGVVIPHSRDDPKVIRHIIRNLGKVPEPPEIENLTEVHHYLKGKPPQRLFHSQDDVPSPSKRSNLQLTLVKKNGQWTIKNSFRAMYCMKNGHRSYICSGCGFTKATKPAVVSHIRQVHTFEDPQLCSCGYSTYSDDCWQQHIREGCIGAYKCRKCSFIAKTPSKLKRHMVSHSNRKTVMCVLCERHFKYTYQLKRHNNICC